MIGFLCVGCLLDVMHCHATTRVRVASLDRRDAPERERYHIIVVEVGGRV